MEITRKCNYRCRYCHMWTLRDSPDALTTDEKISLIESFAMLNPKGRIVFTGGEVMMKPEFFQLIEVARGFGLETATNTNGSFVPNLSYELVLRQGPDYLVFSLDSHSPRVHDYNRGISGSFEATVDTILGLLALRRQLSEFYRVKLFTNSVLTSDNIGDLQAFVTFATELGLDGCTFQVLSPTFYRRSLRDRFYERKFFPDQQLAIQALQELREQLAHYPVVKSSDEDLRWMQVYIAHPHALTEQICNSHERNMMVDHIGDVLLCFDMRKIFGGNPIGNVKDASLSDLWHGSIAADAREIMKNCRHPCGILNCHRRETTA